MNARRNPTPLGKRWPALLVMRTSAVSRPAGDARLQDLERRGLLPGNLHEVVERVRQVRVERAHVVALAHAEDVVRVARRRAGVGLHEAIEHLQQEGVQPLELVPREALRAEPRAHLVDRRQVLGGRVGVVLHVRERGLDLRDVHAAGVAGVAAGHVARLTGLRVPAGIEVGLELAVQPLEIGDLLQGMAERLAGPSPAG